MLTMPHMMTAWYGQRRRLSHIGYQSTCHLRPSTAVMSKAVYRSDCFAELAKRGYYNGLVFHRIIPVCLFSLTGTMFGTFILMYVGFHGSRRRSDWHRERWNKHLRSEVVSSEDFANDSIDVLGGVDGDQAVVVGISHFSCHAVEEMR